MVRKTFIKELQDIKLTVWDKIIDVLWYNKFAIFLRKIGRFILRLPNYVNVCWKNEDWDYEGFYNLIELHCNRLKKAIKEDTWHVPHGVKRELQQIDLTLAHLDRYRNWPNYYEWPEPIHEKLPNGCYTIKYKPEDEAQCDYVHKMELKHYEAFWRLLKKYHTNWWT